ncbi:MAG TPA: Uma2 family endonuclease [Solirubrobacteraceae bacterium]|nr:Uma2 family endonuclease [Solirubrobacteraceae bacterium]
MAHAPTAGSRMSQADFWALVDSGELAEAPVELIDGRLYAMSPQSDEHKLTIKQLMLLLGPALAELEVQMSLKLPVESAPEPDLALTRPRPRGVGVDEPRLVIEVVWTQWREAMRKLPVYAAASVGECWIVDIPKRLVHVHDRPEGREYGRTRTFAGADVLEPPGTEIRFTAAEVFARLDE